MYASCDCHYLSNCYKMFTQKTTVDVGMVKKYGNKGLCSDAALAIEPTCKDMLHYSLHLAALT